MTVLLLSLMRLPSPTEARLSSSQLQDICDMPPARNEAVAGRAKTRPRTDRDPREESWRDGDAMIAASAAAAAPFDRVETGT